ncbi:MAG: FAD-dependent oxidoreductase [Phycisphaerales bacterium]|nr:MAG: FAD-dependent oxidoreductase [Phycisphaerales bacterium]
MSQSRPDVIVVGGGVAGIAASVRLAGEGARVLLLETRKKLGGRATSFTDVRTGETLDNCQHVALACCVNYLDLCARLGVDHLLRWTEEIHWAEPGGRISTMRPGPLPAPGHFTGSMLRATFLDLSEKRAIAGAMLAILRTREASGTFGDWLRARRQPERAVRRFWEPVVVSACNLGVDRVDASCAIKVFRDGFLAARDASRMSVAGVPLVRLYDPAERAIHDAGGEVRLGVSVSRVGETSVTTDAHETIVAERVICAVPPERGAKIIDADLRVRDTRLHALERFTHSPILGVHLELDRPVMDLPHAVLLDQRTQWVFNKDETPPPPEVARDGAVIGGDVSGGGTGATSGGGGASGGQRLHAVVSAADEWMGLTEEEIGARVLEDVRACFPRAHDASLVRVRAVKEKRATFAATPEVERIRPTITGETSLLLAGDYTRVGWPATMEGATRSGYLAAAACLGKDEAWALSPDLAPALLPRMLRR